MTLEEIPVALANGVGVVGCLVILFWLLATGRLVTRREADGIAEDRNAWREAATESRGLLTQLLTNQETSNRLLRALPGVASRAEGAEGVGD